ncbi:MAG TPA: sugar transferase [Actinobacteria bacterium]|nr:sugar transferase [Actinomycetota bacterium]
MSKSLWRFVSITADIIFINIAIIMAFLIRFNGQLPAFNFRAYTNLAVFISLIQIMFLYIYDLYKPERTEGFSSILTSIIQAVTVGTIFTASLTFFVRFFSFPRSVFLLSWVLLIFLLTVWRMVGALVFKIDWPEQRIIVVGTGELAQQIVAELEKRTEWGYRIVGIVGKKISQIGRRVGRSRVIGIVSDIVPLIKEHEIDRVIVTTPIRQRELLEDMARSAEADVKVEIVPDLYEIFIGRVDYNLLSDIPLIELTKDPVPGWVSLLKKMGDFFGALLLFILLSPVMLVCAILVKITSPGPALFSQERVGQAKTLFRVHKFRTMIADAERATGPVLADSEDERITPFGMFLRRYRLDELPQLLNIIKGEMSFVGPRPERSFFIKQFEKIIPGYSERFKVKPGLTGLAQVSGSYATTPSNKLKYDLIYIYHQSIFLDIKIIFSTIRVVLTARGSR